MKGDEKSGKVGIPESVVSGVLMSACASTQTTHASGWWLVMHNQFIIPK